MPGTRTSGNLDSDSNEASAQNTTVVLSENEGSDKCQSETGSNPSTPKSSLAKKKAKKAKDAESKAAKEAKAKAEKEATEKQSAELKAKEVKEMADKYSRLESKLVSGNY